MANKVIIEVRINEYAMRDQNPNVPYSPEEIANQALECWREGASIIHYHARNPQTGAPASDPKLYAETVRRIKEKSDLITMPTLGAWWMPSPEARIAHIVEMAKDPLTKPEFGPIDMATSNVDTYDPKAKRFTTTETVYLNTTKTWQFFAETMKSVGVKPMPALWTVPSLRATQAFVEMGLFEEPLYCELILTENWLLSGHPGTVKGMEAFLDFLPQQSKWQWSVMCVGGEPASHCGGGYRARWTYFDRVRRLRLSGTRIPHQFSSGCPYRPNRPRDGARDRYASGNEEDARSIRIQP